MTFICTKVDPIPNFFIKRYRSHHLKIKIVNCEELQEFILQVMIPQTFIHELNFNHVCSPGPITEQTVINLRMCTFG